MPTISCGFPNPGVLQQIGPTISVDIGFDPAWTLTGGNTPVAGTTNVSALIDTGASACCIDSGLALTLNLPIVDQRPCSGIGGAHLLNVHMAQILIPGLGHTIYGLFMGVHLSAGGQPHLALLGRDFLAPMQMTYNGVTGVVEVTRPAAPVPVLGIVTPNP